MALVGGEGVELPGVFKAQFDATHTALVEGGEVVLGGRVAALGGAGEPGHAGRGIGTGELAGEVEKSEFGLCLDEVAVGGGKEVAVSLDDARGFA